jgi:hypothetical protein
MMMRKCTANEFTCQLKNQCVPLTAVCDGIQVSLVRLVL